MSFKLQLDPSERIVFAGSGQKLLSTLKVCNPTSERVAYKLKCTSNEMFRIRPPVGILNNGESSSIQIEFDAKKFPQRPKEHYFTIYYVNSADEKPAREIWKSGVAPIGTKKIFIDLRPQMLQCFVYDPAMDHRKIMESSFPTIFCGSDVIAGWKLDTFSSEDEGWKVGATAVPDADSCLSGAVYKIPSIFVRDLDNFFEGYKRVSVRVSCENGETVEYLLYVWSLDLAKLVLFGCFVRVLHYLSKEEKQEMLTLLCGTNKD